MPIDQKRRTSQPQRVVKGPVKKAPVKRSGGGRSALVFFAVALVIIVIVAGYLIFGRDRGPSETSGISAGGIPKGGTAVQGASDAVPQEHQYVLNKAKLQFESVDNKNTVRVVIDKAIGKSGAEITYKFDWSVNGKPAGDGGDNLSGFKGGDKIAVKVTPFDGENALQPSRVLTFDITNTPPTVNETKDATFDGKRLTYQVKGVDQDGNPLTYSLENAPQGMTINPQTGVIDWQLKEGDYGEHSIKVKVANSKGGVTMHTVKLDLPKPAEEKKP